MDSKPIWKTKTFWLGLGATALDVAQVLTGTHLVPEGSLTAATAILAVVLRRYSSGDPVHVVTPRTE